MFIYDSQTEKYIEDYQGEDVLFHFTKKDVGIECILKDAKLMLGTFKGTNDPYEYKKRQIALDTRYKHGEVTNEMRFSFENKRHLIQVVPHIINEAAFLSFCKNQECVKNEKISLIKSRMWSQYGENHKGICFTFSKKKLLKDLKSKFSRGNIIFNDNINYLSYSEMDDLLEGQDIFISPSEFNQPDEYIIKKYFNEKLKSIFYAKHNDYKDEEEYRILIFNLQGKPLYGQTFNIMNSLTGIFLGDSFPSVYFESVYSLSEKLSVPVFKLSWLNSRYAIKKLR